jgi:hypothetical protein
MRALVGGALVVAVGGVALLASAPEIAKQRVLDTLQQRWGLRGELDDVDLGVGGLGLTNLRISTQDAKGLRVVVKNAEVRAGLWRSIFGAAPSIDSVDARGVEIQIDVGSAEVKKLLEVHAVGGAPGAIPRRAESAEERRDISLTGVAVTIHSGAVELLRVAGMDVRGSDADIVVTVPSAHVVTPESGWSGDLTSVRVGATRAHRWQLESVVVARSRWLWTSPERAQTTADADGPGSQGADPDLPRTPQVAEIASAAQPAASMVAAGKARTGAPEPELIERVSGLLAGGSELRMDDIAIATATDGKQTPLLNAMRARVRVESDDELKVSVHGQAEGSGRLDVELQVRPKQLRADGRVTLVGLPLTLVAPLLPDVAWHEPERSKIDADLSIKTESLERLVLEGRAELRDAGVWSPRLAATPVRNVGFSLTGRGHFYPLRRRLEIEHGELGLGEAKVQLSGSLEHSAEHYAVDVVATLPATPCTAAIQAVPADLLGDLSLARWNGTLGARLRFAVDSRKLEETVLDLRIQDQCAFVSVPAMADLRRFSEPFVHSVGEPDDTVFEMETGPGSAAWTPIAAISPFLLHAVLTHEDPGFFSHKGFSLLHIRNALERNLRERRYAVGASTITMQLVKNIFLRREKTLARKLQEVLLTWWIERVLPKPQILELYLNVIEYGPSVYGIRHASRHYFNRLPSDLSPAEAVFFATILPNPKRYHAYFERGSLTPTWVTTMRKLMNRLGERGAYSPEAVAYGLQEIEHFKFVPEGTAAPIRALDFGAQLLPLETGAYEIEGAADDSGYDDGFDENVGENVDEAGRVDRN